MIHFIRRTAAAAAALLLAISIFTPAQVQAQDKAKDVRHRPFVHAYNASGSLEDAAAAARAKLEAAGFTIAGEYSPYDGTRIIVVTSEALQAATSKTDFGAFGAAQRVAITAPVIEETGTFAEDGELQVTYTNPTYMALAYRLDDDLATVRSALEGALGSLGEYGSAKGKKAKTLRKYRYKPIIMPSFKSRNELISYGSYEEALAKVEEGLAAGTAGTSKVYRIDIPGKEQTLFGVAMTRECSSDSFVMTSIDFRDVRSSAHLPYEILVSGGKVYALHAKFRIAISFPDLSMMAGGHTFMDIMCSPGDIEDALGEAAGVAP